MLGNPKIQAILEDHRNADIPEAEKVLLSFLEKVNRAPATIRPEDIALVKSAGWSEEAIYDAVNVCALFNFYNRWNDAAGTADMSAEAYAMSGKRLATGGYQ